MIYSLRNRPRRSGRAFLTATASIALPLAASILPGTAQAQTPATGASETDDARESIVITALIPRNHIDVLAGTSVLSGEALARELRPNLGETLARQPGVTATSFGPNASRPILRGFSGDRIRLLTDGIGSFDVSATSVDHAVAINPLLADRIEVLHGPAALLYGSSAVGGVVNVIDNRIPTRAPSGGFAADLDATYGSAAEERSLAGRADAALGGGFILHMDGTYSKTADLRIGGAVLAPALRAQAAASTLEDIRALADLRDRLPNSAAESWSYGGSLAWLDDTGGSIGFSLSKLHTLYGVPIRYSFAPDEEAEAVRIRMDQTRADLRAVIPAGGTFLDEVKLRAGWAGYRHDELEEDGAIGSTFRAQGMEARVEAVQARRGGWDGAFGGQIVLRKGRIEGEEKFQPAHETESVGLFALQSLELGGTRLEAGLRYEHAVLTAAADAQLGTPDWRRRFDTFSASAGISQALAPGWQLGLNLSRSERAPSVDELFSRGNHAGTQAFELGNPDFGTERGWGLEALLHGGGRDYHFSVSAYYNRFSGFIYDHRASDADCMAANGGEPLELPCYRFGQADARYLGAEIEGDATLARLGAVTLKADAMADYTRATLVDGGPVPRIPPLRLRGGLTAETNRVTARIEAEHAFAQTRVSAGETETAAFTLLNASLGWQPLADTPSLRLLLSATNILDVDARRHASLLKDYAPLAGRDIRVTLSMAL